MRRTAAIVAALLGACLAAPALAGAAIPLKEPREGAGVAEVLPVRIAPGAAARGSVAFARTVPGLVTLLVTFDDRPGAEEALRRLVGVGLVRPLAPEAGIWSVRPAAPASGRAAALGREGVASAEWSLERRSDQAREAAPAPLPLVDPGVFTDEFANPSGQWPLYQASTWEPALTGTATRPRIAVLDGGIDVRHEEWSGAGSPLVAPRSTIQGGPDADDWGRSGHGTHVAGIAAAPANGLGIVGVAPARAGVAEVIPVQIADRDGRSSDETMIAGIRWAVRNGAQVINISAGGPGFSRAFQSTVNWAYSRGVLIVASVGNEGEDENVFNYPAGYDHVIGVGAQCDGQIDPPDCPRAFGVAAFSNNNRSVDLIAPGVNVLSTVPRRVSERQVREGYALKDGTSMASPYVAGTAALVFAVNPGVTPYQVMRQLLNTATDIGRAGRDELTGVGVVNPGAAVRLTVPPDDPTEANDDVADLASRRSFGRESRRVAISAFADRFNDPDDVYPLQLRAGQRVSIRLAYRTGSMSLYLWRPGTPTVSTDRAGNVRSNLVAAAANPRRRAQVVTVTARASGRYYVNVYARRGGGDYTLTIVKS